MLALILECKSEIVHAGSTCLDGCRPTPSHSCPSLAQTADPTPFLRYMLSTLEPSTLIHSYLSALAARY